MNVMQLLVNARKQRGLTQYDIAKRLGVNRARIAHIEQGLRRITLEETVLWLRECGLELAVTAMFRCPKCEAKLFASEENPMFFQHACSAEIPVTVGQIKDFLDRYEAVTPAKRAH